MSDHSDTESFKSAKDDSPNAKDERFSPEEEASLLATSNDNKATANALFSRAAFDEAIQSYDKALSFCPTYLEYDVAVLRSNIAACHIKLADWKAAIESATQSIDCLERLDPSPLSQKKKDDGGSGGKGKAKDGESEGVIEEIDDETAEKIEALQKSGRTRDEVQRIRIKALLRRAKGRSEVGGWAALQGAEEDYKVLASMRELTALDRKTVDAALRILPSRLDEARQKEMGEMMDKLKGLGNGILRPFGLSTDNFQFTKDDKTGGYSMNFNQGAGK